MYTSWPYTVCKRRFFNSTGTANHCTAWRIITNVEAFITLPTVNPTLHRWCRTIRMLPKAVYSLLVVIIIFNIDTWDLWEPLWLTIIIILVVRLKFTLIVAFYFWKTIGGSCSIPGHVVLVLISWRQTVILNVAERVLFVRLTYASVLWRRIFTMLTIWWSIVCILNIWKSRWNSSFLTMSLYITWIVNLINFLCCWVSTNNITIIFIFNYWLIIFSVLIFIVAALIQVSSRRSVGPFIFPRLKSLISVTRILSLVIALLVLFVFRKLLKLYSPHFWRRFSASWRDTSGIIDYIIIRKSVWGTNRPGTTSRNCNLHFTYAWFPFKYLATTSLASFIILFCINTSSGSRRFGRFRIKSAIPFVSIIFFN